MVKIHRLKENWHKLAILAAMLIIALTGVVHGLWTHRWGTNEDLIRAAARLKKADLNFEGWKGHDLELDPAKLKLAEIVGYRSWLAEQERTQRAVSLLLLCGEHGPISVHTPQYCYGGVGYEMVGDPVHHEFTLPDGKIATLWTARFHKPEASGEPPLRIFWGWNDGAGWQAPEYPRASFFGALFKIYAVREMKSLDDPLESDPCVALLKQALPRLQKELF